MPATARGIKRIKVQFVVPSWFKSKAYLFSFLQSVLGSLLTPSGQRWEHGVTWRWEHRLAFNSSESEGFVFHFLILGNFCWPQKVTSEPFKRALTSQHVIRLRWPRRRGWQPGSKLEEGFTDTQKHTSICDVLSSPFLPTPEWVVRPGEMI